MTTPQVLERIHREIIETGRENRYRLSAYAFVLAGLEFCRAKTGHRCHVTGQELSYALAEFAAKQFGPLAYSVLKSWGIRATDDFGYIVYNLIDINILRKQESDSLQDFFGVVDMKVYFGNQDHYVVDKARIVDIEGA